jgi:hypothetical protein
MDNLSCRWAAFVAAPLRGRWDMLLFEFNRYALSKTGNTEWKLKSRPRCCLGGQVKRLLSRVAGLTDEIWVNRVNEVG